MSGRTGSPPGSPDRYRGASYAFVTNGKLAAGIHTNVMDENLRAIVTTTGKDGERTFAAAPGKWTYREIATETIPPVAKLVVAADAHILKDGSWKVTKFTGSFTTDANPDCIRKRGSVAALYERRSPRPVRSPHRLLSPVSKLSRAHAHARLAGIHARS